MFQTTNQSWICVLLPPICICIEDHPQKHDSVNSRILPIVLSTMTTWYYLPLYTHYIPSGWWLQPFWKIWKIWKSAGVTIPNIWKQCYKSPTSHYMSIIFRSNDTNHSHPTLLALSGSKQPRSGGCEIRRPQRAHSRVRQPCEGSIWPKDFGSLLCYSGGDFDMSGISSQNSGIS